jgi:hypothetical protein
VSTGLRDLRGVFKSHRSPQHLQWITSSRSFLVARLVAQNISPSSGCLTYCDVDHSVSDATYTMLNGPWGGGVRMAKRCLKCGSIAVDTVNAEVSFARGLAAPVYTLGKMAVCLDCGSAEYLVPEEPLAQLRQGAPSQLQQLRGTCSPTMERTAAWADAHARILD